MSEQFSSGMINPKQTKNISIFNIVFFFLRISQMRRDLFELQYMNIEIIMWKLLNY